MRKIFFTAVGAVALAWGATASAIDFDSAGVWSSIEGNPDPAFFNPGLDGSNNVVPPASTIEWGRPAIPENNPGQIPSRYIFTGVVGGDAPTNGVLFALGDFTHDNFAIRPSGGFDVSIEAANLDIDITFNMPGPQFFTDTVRFGHNETPNSEPPPCDPPSVLDPPVPCPDVVSIPDDAQISGLVVDDMGTEYAIQIIGFSTDGGLTTTTGFVTEENQSNTATLYARLVPIPEPPTVALMGLALLGLAGFTRRRR